MKDNVYCTFSERTQANLAIERMRQLGYRPEDVLVVDKPEALEHIIHAESDANRSTVLGGVYGFVYGVLLGIAVLAYMGHGLLGVWGVPVLLGLNGLGWALVGTIIGCSGLLVTRRIPAGIEHQLEKKVGDDKLVLAFPLQSKEKLSSVRAVLKDVGAADIYCSVDAV